MINSPQAAPYEWPVTTTQVFAILKILSNEVKPRYHIAYDDRYFDKSSVIYLTDFLFKNKV